MYAKVFVPLGWDDKAAYVTDRRLARRAFQLVAEILVLEELCHAVRTLTDLGQSHGFFDIMDTLLQFLRLMLKV